MSARYTLRMQFGPHQDAEAIGRRLVELCRNASVEEVMFFYFAEEQNDGHDPLERIRLWIDHSRVYRNMLADAGVAISLNPWHSVLHTDRNRRLKPGQDWQNMVDPRGRAATAVVCPLDPKWREYYDETMRLYARERFRVIWVDDDIRCHNHDPLHWGGCFCPLHVAEFNRRASVDATREEIVRNCLAPGEPHPWRGMWFDMWQETLLAMIARWREIVEAEGCRLGLMSSLMEQHAAEGRRWNEWWTAFGGKKPPIHRPHFWAYSDTSGDALPMFLHHLDQNRRIQPPGAESGPEIECFVYCRWNKSFRQLGAQLSAALVLGSNNLNISLYDFMGNHPDDEPQRETFLKAYRPTADWLAATFPMTLKTVGIGIPWSEDVGRCIHTETPRADDWFALVCPSTHAWAGWLGSIGYAFSAGESNGVNAVAGPSAWAFTGEQLRRWLQCGLLLDGPAAALLFERGFGDLIGLKSCRFITQEEVLYSVENCTDADFGARHDAQMGINLGGYAARLLQGELAEGAHTISDLRGPTRRVVGHGMVLFENALGGRVAIAPWTATDHVVMTPQRAAQLHAVLHYLSGNKPLGQVRDAAWLFPQFLTDGQIHRTAVWNASPDEVDVFTLDLPSEFPSPERAFHIDAHGRRNEATITGNRITLSQPLHQWELVIILGKDEG